MGSYGEPLRGKTVSPEGLRNSKTVPFIINTRFWNPLWWVPFCLLQSRYRGLKNETITNITLSQIQLSVNKLTIVFTGSALDNLPSNSKFMTSAYSYNFMPRIAAASLNQMDVTKPNFKRLTYAMNATQINSLDPAHLKALDSSQISAGTWAAITPANRLIIDPTRT